MARVTHRAVQPLTAREAEDMPVLAATGATATAARCVVQREKERRKHVVLGAESSARASRSAARATEGRGACLKEGAPPGRESPNMRSPEAWTRKRIGETHATRRSRTTGATGARKSEAATTRIRAALYARERSDGESGQDGQESAVGTPVRQNGHRLVRLRQVRGRREGGGVGQIRAPPATRVRSPNADGLQDGADDISEVSQALHSREPAAGAARCAPRRQKAEV
eukprot:6193405-Pleurochrysis_carterae.AAC.5